MLKAICFQHSAICFFVFYSLNTEFLKKMAETKKPKNLAFSIQKKPSKPSRRKPPGENLFSLFSTLLHSIFLTKTQWSVEVPDDSFGGWSSPFRSGKKPPFDHIRNGWRVLRVCEDSNPNTKCEDSNPWLKQHLCNPNLSFPTAPFPVPTGSSIRRPLDWKNLSKRTLKSSSSSPEDPTSTFLKLCRKFFRGSVEKGRSSEELSFWYGGDADALRFALALLEFAAASSLTSR